MDSDILYFDIETAPNEAMVDYVDGPSKATAADAPKNYKKQDVIDNWVLRENAKRNEEYLSRLSKMSLDIDFAKITEIGYAVGGEQIFVAQVDDNNSEGDVLWEFWNAACPMINAGVRSSYPFRVCGFNVLEFDLPMILRRSFMLGVVPPYRIDLRRYSIQSVIDLMQLFYNWGNAPGPKYRGLKDICKMHGIHNGLPDLDGSMMAEMDAETRRLYVTNDVAMTRDLAYRMNWVYWV